MLNLTMRILDQVYALQAASIRYQGVLDPDLAILLSFDEATQFYNDLFVGPGSEIHMFVNELPYKTIDLRELSHDLRRPPFPTGQHVVWASLEGIKIAIKGREDS